MPLPLPNLKPWSILPRHPTNCVSGPRVLCRCWIPDQKPGPHSGCGLNRTGDDMPEQITSSPAEFLQGHGLSARRMLPIFAAATALLLTACSEPEMRLAGERIDVLPERVIETADAAAFAACFASRNWGEDCFWVGGSQIATPSTKLSEFMDEKDDDSNAVMSSIMYRHIGIIESAWWHYSASPLSIT